VVGKGKSDMETYLATAGKKQNRVLVEEEKPQAGYYYRSDHFNFAKVGVPALYAGGGQTPIDDATAQYRKRIKFENGACYHEVCDHYKENWDLSGAIQDLQLYFNVGYDVANAQVWPAWSETSEFQRNN
jgi:Zn-dependent M28 family amino/carboxypeptidase